MSEATKDEASAAPTTEGGPAKRSFPQAGGSYLRQADGSLERVQHTAPAGTVSLHSPATSPVTSPDPETSAWASA